MQLTVLDLLYLVLALAILLFTIYFVVFMIEATRIMKDVKIMTSRMAEIVDTAGEIPTLIANKILNKMKGKKSVAEEEEEN